MKSLGTVAMFVLVVGCALDAPPDDRPEASAGSLGATAGAGAVAGAGAGGSDQSRGGSATSGGGSGRSSGGAGGRVDPPTAGAESDGGEDTGAAGRSDGDGGEDAVVGRGGSGRGGTGASGTGGTGGDAGSGSDPEPCGECPATHECIGGECFIRPECDCAAFGVECSPLSAALKADFACPVEVQCGECGPNHLCGGYRDNERLTERVCAPRESSCLTIDEWRQEGYSGPTPSCPVPDRDPRCSEPYALCSMRIFLVDDGVECPSTSTDPFTGIYWMCGPPPT
jgi:hypothetical protein